MRKAYHPLAIACGLFAVCLGAEPKDDPGGWGDLKFGMSPDEVLEALGPGGFVQEAPAAETQRPFGLDETTDIPAAVGFAKQQVEKAKEAPDSVPEVLLTPCKELLAEMKRFMWVARDGNNPHTQPEDRKKPPKKVSGVLDSITSWGAKKTTAYQRTLQIKTARAIVPLGEVVLDPDSQGKLARIEDAIADIASAMQRLEELASIKAGPKPPEPTPADSVRAHPIKIRGLELTPRISFDGEKLTRIRLGMEYGGDGGAGFNEHGMQQTLVEGLKEKYGPADERNSTDNGVEYLWRFPTTVIRCRAGRLSFPGRLYVQKWVSVSYEQPSVANAPTKDKL